MNIKQIKIEDIIPYGKNPRKNDVAVDAVKNSIREFGFKVPIVVDRDGVVVTGHTRLKAAKALGLKEVPAIVADDLTDEQAKAFRLADNKVAEKSEWDIDLLNEELQEITDIDMTEFDFEIPDFTSGIEEDDLGYYGDARERTNQAYNLEEFDETRASGFYQMPTLKACDHIPDHLIGFNYAKSSQDKKAGIHFFIDDYQFERVWNDPQSYIPILEEYDCCLTPDFSLYMDMPMAMKIWNVYRSRLVGQLMQDAGIKVIPTLSWAEPETFSFCFDGIEPGGTVAVSTVGVMRDKEAMAVWKTGMDAAIERIKPKNIVCYGSAIDYDFGQANVKNIAARKFGDGV